VAVLFEDQQLTYQELNQRANQLAHALIARGIGQEDLVGIAMERSLELVVGLLGILKAGAAYLPLDPVYPRERLAFMLKEGQVSLLLTQPHVQKQVPDHQRAVLCLDASWQAIAAESTQNPPPRSTSDNAVYVIFTSGSTGQPKGIVIQHAALVNHALAMVEATGLTPGQRFLQFASISFDASAVQIYPTLISGATLVLHPNPTALSTYDLWRFCEVRHVTVLDIPVAYWQQWIDDMATSQITLQPPLQVCMTGGELPDIEKVRLWARITRQPAVFISSYGPTEATITAAIFLTPNNEEVLARHAMTPLGHPLANVAIYLLDSWMYPVPTGATGEVYIGGAGLARGYPGNLALTAASFVPDPLGPRPGARLYKTGDLARYLPDGTLEFQGRRDHQVKIRGFRIEPGEIEALLNQHWAVQRAVVLARQDIRGELSLVAAILPAWQDQAMIARLRGRDTAEEKPTESEQARDVSLEELQRDLLPVLRRFLKERLPAYMIPAAFVLLKEFPLSQSGKVDLQAIPTPDMQPASLESYVAPRTVVEEILLTIWMELLARTQVGIHDSFFDLGGHSLLATQLISQVRRVFKLELPLHRLFEAPTVAEFAEILRQAETQPGQVLAIARRRKQIESMSADEIRARLLQEKKSKG
jgi:amino acid adenylation domain-containing protein